VIGRAVRARANSSRVTVVSSFFILLSIKLYIILFPCIVFHHLYDRVKGGFGLHIIIEKERGILEIGVKPLIPIVSVTMSPKQNAFAVF
jgi:hypothetical protein